MTDAEPLSMSPAAAYRADIEGRNGPFGGDDDQWLVAATTLHLAAGSADAHRKDLLHEALGHAIDLLGDRRIDTFVEREWRGERSYVESMVLLADLVHWAGALRLAALMFDDLLRAAKDLSGIERGRILALRARVERKLGRLDDATDRYAYVAALGRIAKSPELEARAELGFIALAQLRGNLPALRAHARRAVAIADRHDLPSIARLAYQGLTVAETKDRRYDAALVAIWKVVQLSHGDAALESEALQNLGQLMLEAGHPAVARASFAAVTTRPAPARILLPALGGLALASARCGNEATVEWSMREVWRARQSGADGDVPRYELAAALLECATALDSLQRIEESNRYRAAALELARAHDFHELVFRIEEAEPSVLHVAAATSAVPALDSNAADVARQVAALEPEQLPMHVRFEAAPA